MAKQVNVVLYRPDGGSTLWYEDVEVTHHDKGTIDFTKRTENEDGKTVTVVSYTSNLPYLISDSVSGPKSLI